MECAVVDRSLDLVRLFERAFGMPLVSVGSAAWWVLVEYAVLVASRVGFV